MYIYLYVCMYVCMDGWMDVCMYVGRVQGVHRATLTEGGGGGVIPQSLELGIVNFYNGFRVYPALNPKP